MSRRSLQPRWLRRALDEAFICPSCARKAPKAINRGPSQRQQRWATTLSSNTAINASRSVHEQYRALYSALGDVRRNAAAHVPISRLQLALAGLESTSPRIRVAVLGLNVADTAKRLVRLLLSDPLEQEAQWEWDLTHDQGRFENGLLVRYGQAANPNLAQSNTSIPVLEVPAGLLERANIEILISTVSMPAHRQHRQIPVDTFLAPVIGTPSAFSGRHTIISQPVHRAVVVAKGLEELFQVAELLAASEISSDEERNSIKVVLQNESGSLDGDLAVIDSAKAEAGLRAIRSSLAKATTYEHLWMESGLSQVTKWLTSISGADTKLPAPVADLISAILQSASTSLKTQAKADAESRRTDLSTLTNLSSTIDDFSRNAHKELQSGLSSAWSSRNWRKLAWYKLFWRVDDVGLIVTDLVSNAWLPRTERAVYEISGRLAQAGISPMDMVTLPVALQKQTLPDPSPATAPLPILQAQAVSTAGQTEPIIVNEGGAPRVELEPKPQLTPLSAAVSATRQTQIEAAILYLSTQAQQLVMRTLSLAGLSAGLSGLTYVSLTNGGIYEAGTIAALGTTFALWRLQGGWQDATKQVEGELYDEGRNVIRRMTARMQQLVDEKAHPKIDEAGQRHWRLASQSVDKAQVELKRLLESSEPSKSK
ncbi:uncharacterized protein AB675_1267 [Cyphellophora attinorum]|uniref:Mmc1 C-terminal domain-containing protein n=1 Tax=Cyphellophora attinorum TaxID=1664694 RepID=A0A0N0NIE6_9EURO|nr:uncharacterized protein AB675_1267 [Phialophora attinorum]KPI35751.1 hypothetical protein AB675_1267 [Phialophora attinorum]